MNPLSTRPNRWRSITVFNLLVGLLFSLSALGQPAFLKEGLVAYYPFNGNANDESENGNNCLKIGSVSFSNANPSSLIASESGYIYATNTPKLNLSNEATFSVWIKSEETKPLYSVFSKATADDNGSYMLSRNQVNGGSFRPHVRTAKGWRFGDVRFSVTKNSWVHILYTFSSNNGLIAFVNGEKMNFSDTLNLPMAGETIAASTSSLLFGADVRDPNLANLAGEIRGFRIYNRALSNSEVKALYAYESTPPNNSFITNGLVAYYPFDGNANDESGNGNNGVVTGATFGADKFGQGNSAANFNGQPNNFISVPNNKAVNIRNQLSITLWTQIRSGGNENSRLLSKGWSPDAVELIVNGTGNQPKTVSFGGGLGGIGYGVDTVSLIENNKWVNLTFTDNGYIRRVYINGVFNNSFSHNKGVIPTNSIDLVFGKNSQLQSGCFDGLIDDVRIYNRALSDGEIRALYDYESTSPIQSPVFVSQPVSKTVNSGDNIVLAVELQTAGTYNYQWQLNEQNIAGATASSLAINNAVAGVYRYRVIVSNSAGTVISDTATLTVNTPPAPSIVTQPAPKAVQEGANVSFNVVATGPGSLVYQWQFNEQNLPGATSATLNLNGVKLNTAGRYRVLISSQYGVTISDTVTLTVNANPPPTIVTQPLSRTPAEGTQVSLTVTATGLGSLTYQWQINNQNIPGATSSTLVLSAVRPSANGSYRVIIGNPYGTTISTEATVTVVVTDADSDSLSDYEELLLGTNANKADSDGDGLSDFAEVRTHGSNPLTTDTDGDGYSDGIEVARDGNPNNRSVTPTGALAVFPAVDVEFYTLNGVKYQLEVSTDMVAWSAQGGLVVGNGGSQNHLVRASKATQFWRLKVVQ